MCMNKQERMLLNLCMSDQLFCTMYDGLNYMHLDYHSPSPAMVWLKSLTAFHDIYESPRPDIMVDIALEGADESVIATVFYMAMVQDMGQRQEPTELKDALCRKLASCTHWRELYERIRNSEEKEECKGRLVNSTDFSSRELPVFSDTSTKAIAVEELVDMTLSMNNVTFSRGVAYLLRRLDDSRDGAFRSEIVKLERFADSFNVKTNAQLDEIVKQQKSSEEILKKAADKKAIGTLVMEQNNYPSIPANRLLKNDKETKTIQLPIL